MRTRAPFAVAAVASLMLCTTGCRWITRVSVDGSGAETPFASYAPAVSADGRVVAMTMGMPDPGGVGLHHVVVRDLAAGTLTPIPGASVLSQGASISADGRYVAWTNRETVEDSFGPVLVYDRQAGTTERADVSTAGAIPELPGEQASISADGRFVTFVSQAGDLVAGDTNGVDDVFVRDLQTDTTTRVSLSTTGAQLNFLTRAPTISGDGRYVAFASRATNVSPGDSNGNADDVWVRDRQVGTTTMVSANLSGGYANEGSVQPAISSDGRFVAFSSGASDLVAGDGTRYNHEVFVRNLAAGTTTRASVDTTGGDPGAQSESLGPVLSADGSEVAFVSTADDLVPGDGNGGTNGGVDAFVRDLTLGSTTRVSTDAYGHETSGVQSSYRPAITADGAYVAFTSSSADLVPGDTNLRNDVFMKATTSPTVQSVGPPAPRGTATVLSVTGSGFRPGTSVTVGGPGVTVTSVTFVSSTSLQVSVTVSAGADATARNLTVGVPGPGPGVIDSLGSCLACVTIT